MLLVLEVMTAVYLSGNVYICLIERYGCWEDSKLTALRNQNYKRRKKQKQTKQKTESNPAWSSGANLRL